MARALSVGTALSATAANLPREYDLQGLECAVLRQPITVNRESLLYQRTEGAAIILDNPQNDACTSGVIVAVPKYKAFVLVGF